MKKFSLNKRLISAVVISQLLLTAAMVIVGTSFSRHYIRRAFDVYLEGRAQSVAAIVFYPDDGGPGLMFNDEKVPPEPRHGPQELFYVRSNLGNFERHNSGYDPHVFDSIPPNARFWDVSLHGQRYHAIILRDVPVQDTEEGVPLPLPKLTVIYAAPTHDVDFQIRQLAFYIGLVSLVILVPILMLALLFIRKALTPLHDLTVAAGEISADSWEFKTSEAAASTRELEPLIEAITTVLAGLESAFRRQREFLGDAAHELKTSLAILKSSLQTLLSKQREPAEYQNGLSTMNRDCERLERLLNRMLQTARVEQRIADRKEQAKNPVDVASSCEGAIAQLAQFAAAREIQIDFKAKGEAMVRAEMADLELIWLNLLENAIQYSPPGATVFMRLSVQDGMVCVLVSDPGCGIESSHLPLIFERFYRADSSRARSTGGFGLGLAITKSLVNLYHGRIRAESQPGQGTSIWVEFPLDSSNASSADEGNHSGIVFQDLSK